MREQYLNGPLIGEQLRLLTFNLWWGEPYQLERLEAVRDIVRWNNPDVIAFQEVSARTLDTFNDLFQDYKIWPQFPGYAGTAILTQRRWLERGQLRLMSHQGRELIWLSTPELLIATVHLESTSGQTQARIDQLDQIFHRLEPYERVVLLGDFNFAPNWVEQAHISADYLDAWHFLHPDQPGFTEDTSTNLMRLRASGKEKQVRFDRVLCKGGIKPIRIELVGTTALPGLPEVWPSDHFGLVCDIEFTGQSPPRFESDSQLLMLGKDHIAYGKIEQHSLGHAVAGISVGATPNTPSMAAKANKSQPNEDGLLISKEGTRYMLAVADGHFGIQTSHALLNRLSKRNIPASRELLHHAVLGLEEPNLMLGAGSTLLVAVVDTANGDGFGVSVGDCTLALLSNGNFTNYSEADNGYFYFNNPPGPDDWHRFDFALGPDDLLILHTDGINECHYRSPETSIQPAHILELWERTKPDSAAFSKLLMKLALQGLMGQPGGQDNIALIAFQRSI
jgi:tyrosyl-DNA phosphodiesterase 2